MAYTLTPFEVMTELKETASRNEKIEILKRESDNRLFRLVVKAALDPYIHYHIKKIPDYKSVAGSFITMKIVIDRLAALSTRQLTGARAINHLAKLLESLDADDAKTLECIIKKKLDCGVDISSVNKAWGNDFIQKFPVMLCQPQSEKSLAKIKYPAIVQEKKDGLRIAAIVENGKVDLRTRNGNPLKSGEALTAITDEIVKLSGDIPLVFDGEANVVDADGKDLPRKISNGILNREKLTDDEISRIRFTFWDMITLPEFRSGVSSTPYIDRFTPLVTLVNNNESGFFSVPRYKNVTDLSEAIDFYKRLVGEGCEGAILKNNDTPWEDKRSMGQVKLKVEEYCDLEIIAIEEGAGKYLGKLGAFECKSSDGGLVVSVGSGFTDKQRTEFFTDNMIGKIVQVKSNDVIDSESKDTLSLFLPIFDEIRTDKNEANTTDFIVESFKSNLA